MSEMFKQEFENYEEVEKEIKDGINILKEKVKKLLINEFYLDEGTATISAKKYTNDYLTDWVTIYDEEDLSPHRPNIDLFRNDTESILIMLLIQKSIRKLLDYLTKATYGEQEDFGDYFIREFLS
ncbi:MAG: hypothetical protein [Caudoviricetes sp.]|nr:MAG: hypothetical protein [Caudoviricetes sp.]